MSPHVHDLVAAMDCIAPPALAQEWDNVGLLIGSEDQPLSRLLVTIDLTEAVLHEAIELSADAIVTYHPVIFQGLKSITTRTPKEHLVLELIRAGIAVYSPHTALDSVIGGVNDWLLTGVGEGDVEALEPVLAQDPDQAIKVTTFLPSADLDAVRQAVSEVGGGRVGEYTSCSFAGTGTGTFFGGETTAPAVGEQGKLEHVEEVRLEMVCAEEDVAGVMAAIEHAHPYEEVAIDVVALEPVPCPFIGGGRQLILDSPMPLADIASSLKAHLGVESLRCAPAGEIGDDVEVIGCCVGAGGSMLAAAIGSGCDLFITGEMGHHDVLAAVAAGCSVLLAGHTNTERGFLPVLADRLCESMPDVEVVVSTTDATPWTVV
jgi:dinuclear metal center YbgI/SA1388 family protein